MGFIIVLVQYKTDKNNVQYLSVESQVINMASHNRSRVVKSSMFNLGL